MSDQVASIVVVQGEGIGDSFVIGYEPSVVGRSRACDIRLDDETVSGSHCRLSFGGQNIELRDLASTRGVYVKGILAAKALLENGDRFEVGDTTFEARIETDPDRG